MCVKWRCDGGYDIVSRMNFPPFRHVDRQIGLLLRSCRRRSFAEDQVDLGGNMLTPVDIVRGSLLLVGHATS